MDPSSEGQAGLRCLFPGTMDTRDSGVGVEHPCVHEIRMSTSDSCWWVVTVKQIMSVGGVAHFLLCCGYELNAGQDWIPRELERKVNVYNATEENMVQKNSEIIH